MTRLPICVLVRLVSRLALAAMALSFPASARADEDDGGYRLHDPALRVRLLATIPGESLAQVVADPAGRLFLGGREAVFVVEAEDVKAGMRPRELYREPGDHWFMGIAPRGEDLYVAKHDAVLVLPGAVRNRGPVVPRPIVWGFPRAKGWAFHQTLHDLKVGPDGKLYFSMGDPAWSFGDFRRPDHWFRTRIETAGTPAQRDVISVGGLFRCDPRDGSDLELVMTGTRNNNGFDWNRDFDLFTTDNDHEQDSRYVPSRLLFVVEGGFYNWPRGWMEDRPENLPAVAGMGREVPVGLAVYDDARLPAGYRGNLLVARWGKQAIDRFIPRREGAGYTATETPWLVCPPGRRPMAVAVGRGGRVYAVVSHMETNAESPTYTADLLEIDRAGPAPAVTGFEPAAATVDELYRALASPDMSRRMPAHVELARRGGDALSAIRPRIAAASREKNPALPHLIRLAGLCRDEEREAALGAILASGLEAEETAVPGLQAAPLDSAHLLALSFVQMPRAQRTVLELLSRPGAEPDWPVLGRLCVALASSNDPYLRQLAARQLARNLASGSRLPRVKAPAERLALVLADGFFLTLPDAYAPLPTGLTLADSAYEEPPAQGPRRFGMFTIDAWWKALEKTPAHQAAFRRLVAALGDPEPAVRLQALRSLDRLSDPRVVPALERLVDAADTVDAATRDQAVLTLARLGGPKELERVVKLLAKAEGSTRRAAAEALVGMQLSANEPSASMTAALDSLAKADGIDPATRQAAIKRLATPALLRTLVLDRQTPEHLRGSALERLAAVADIAALGDVLARIEPTAGSRLTYPATMLAARKLEPAQATRLLGQWLESPSEDARRAAARAIVASKRPELLALARSRLAAETNPQVLRELATLAPGGAAATPPASIPAAFAGVDWAKAWRSGSPERGRGLFRSQTGVACIACHRFRGEGGNNGPSLEEADRRLSIPYLAESVLAPGAQVAPQYRPWTLALKSGAVVTGIVLQETANSLLVGLNDGTTREIARGDVEERKQAETSIMPEGLVKTPDDLRDILAYLLTPG